MNMITKGVAAAVLALGFSVASAEVKLAGSGATFPEPLYKRWATEFHTVHADVEIDYQGVGSGAGIKAITDKRIVRLALMAQQFIQGVRFYNFFIQFELP